MKVVYTSHQNITHCNTLWPFGDIFLEYGYLIFNSISSCLGILGNLLLLAGLFKSKLIKQNTMRIISCLALSDFGISLFVIPGLLIIKFRVTMNCELELILTLVFMLLGFNTANTLLLLSLDRVLLISSPAFYRKWISGKLVKNILCCSWLVSLVLSLCRLFLSPVSISRMLLVIGMVYFTVAFISYIRIFFVVRNHTRKLRDSVSLKPQASNVQSRTVDGNPKPKKRISFKLEVEVFEETAPYEVSGDRNMEVYMLPGVAAVQLQGTGSQSDPSYLPVPKDRKASDYDRKPDSNRDRFDIVKNSHRAYECICDDKEDNGKKVEQIIPTNGQKRPQYFSRFMPLNFHDKDENAWNTKSQHGASFKKELSITSTVAIVIISLFLCYIPYIWSAFLWANMEYTQNIHASYLRRSLYAWALALTFLHSSLSPVIMIVRNKALRRSMKQAMKQLCLLG
ncbi:uncharacterized protein LOC135696626 [Rhopilema esculentum]|uniref:uncharacterized protein LOC135696626 n=1 Tax=Rhopilema esculentum TaxID=499914 RepID=UPI0031D649E0